MKFVKFFAHFNLENHLNYERYSLHTVFHVLHIYIYIICSEQRRLQDDEYPLLVRVMLGPHEDVAKLYLMDRQNTDEISSEVRSIAIH